MRALLSTLTSDAHELISLVFSVRLFRSSAPFVLSVRLFRLSVPLFFSVMFFSGYIFEMFSVMKLSLAEPPEPAKEVLRVSCFLAGLATCPLLFSRGGEQG